MNSYDFETRLLLLKPKVIEAGIKIKSIRDRGEMKTEVKSDGSFVTNADIWANQFFTDVIGREFPGEVIIGEESTDKLYEAGSPFVWYIDPIDGTATYVEGGKDYYILIGLCVNGVPVFGIHYHPESGDLIYGYTGKKPHIIHSRQRSEPIKLRTTFWDETARIYLKTYEKELRDQVKAFGIRRATYSKHTVDMIAPLFARAEGYVSYRPGHFWDLAAPAAIMHSAGFIDSTLARNGTEPILFNDGSVVTNFFYSLPPDAPETFINHIQGIHKQRLL